MHIAAKHENRLQVVLISGIYFNCLQRFIELDCQEFAGKFFLL